MVIALEGKQKEPLIRTRDRGHVHGMGLTHGVLLIRLGGMRANVVN